MQPPHRKPPGATVALIHAIRRAQEAGQITARTAQCAINGIRRGMEHQAIWNFIKASIKHRRRT
jgi:hypothetical protein